MRGLLAAALAALATPATAQDRTLSTDRPDKTESPFTVPAGRGQVEVDLVSHVRDRPGVERVRTTRVLPFNLKYGIGRDTDIQLIAEPFVREVVRASGARQARSGFGDVTVRLKRNLWGNDGGRTAFALMPYVKLPTAATGFGNGHVEGGIIAPLAIELSDRVGLGLMTELDIVRKDDDTGHAASFVTSATVGLDLTERLGVYGEVFAERSAGRGARTIVTFDTGITYAIGEDSQLDVGTAIGATAAADDLLLFVGFSRRF